MSELRAVFLLELRSLYGINILRHTADRKAKVRYRGLTAVWVLLGAMIGFYVGSLVYGLCLLGLSAIVPAYLTVLSALLILAFGLFKAGERIFGTKGYDLLASLPIRSTTLVVSRFLSLYVEDLVLTLVILLPGVAVYGYCTYPPVWVYPVWLVGAVLIPAIPLVISTLLGTLVKAISSRMKRKSLTQTVLMVLLVVGVMAASFRMESVAEELTPEQFTTLAQTVGDVFVRVYPPAVWLSNAVVDGRMLYLLLFAGVSVGVMAAALWTVARFFHGILRRLQNFSARHSYTLGTMQSRSLLKALTVREAKRYFSSSIYVTNTIIGPIMGTIMAVALCVVGVDSLKSALPFAVDIAGLVPCAVGAMFCMMTTTSTAISMEGESFWVVKSLPIPAKPLFDSKILLNLLLMLPFYVVAEVAMVIALRPTWLELVWLLAIPAFLMLFVTVFGITVNLRFHRFDWEREETVVKQSIPAALGGFSGVILGIFLGALLCVAPSGYGDAVKLGICVLLWLGTAILYRQNNQKRLIDLS